MKLNYFYKRSLKEKVLKKIKKGLALRLGKDKEQQ